MLTLQDCIAFSGLTPDQLDAVAHHQHLAPIIAAEWAETTLDRPDGADLVEAALVDEVAHAHDACCRRRLRIGLEEFRLAHPHRITLAC